MMIESYFFSPVWPTLYIHPWWSEALRATLLALDEPRAMKR